MDLVSLLGFLNLTDLFSIRTASQSFVVARLEQVSKNLGLGFGTCSPKKTTPVSNLQWFSPENEIVWKSQN